MQRSGPASAAHADKSDQDGVEATGDWPHLPLVGDATMPEGWQCPVVRLVERSCQVRGFVAGQAGRSEKCKGRPDADTSDCDRCQWPAQFMKSARAIHEPDQTRGGGTREAVRAEVIR